MAVMTTVMVTATTTMVKSGGGIMARFSSATRCTSR